MQKIVFLGYAVSLKQANLLSGCSIAGNKMQVNILKELYTYKDVDLHLFTVYPVASFPRDKIFFNKDIICVTENIQSNRIPFFNISIIKQVWQIISMYLYARKAVDKDTIILTFNQYPQIGIPSMWLKKKSGCKVFALLADLPIDDNYNSTNVIRNLLRKIFDNSTKKTIKECDGLVVLNRNAALKYAPNVPYIVIEGGVNEEELTPIKLTKKKKKNILYSGSLSYYSGIMELVDAMELVDDSEAVLEIYGDGPLKDEIEQLSINKTNVKYCGRVSNEEILKKQRDAYLLVSPRPVNDEISKVTFPSKIFEYLTSGTPVLSTRLAGFGDDFLNVMYTSDESSRELAEEINNLLKENQKQLNKTASEAYTFIKNEKNWKKQVQKIMLFIMKK